MSNLNETIQQLVKKTCSHPPKSLQRNRNLTQLIRLISQSGKLWRESTQYYEDALQLTWLYVCRNLCESITTDKYDETRSLVTTWINRYLKNRLLDYRLEKQKQQKTQVSPSQLVKDDYPNFLDTLPATPPSRPILQELQQWIETTEELETLHLRGRKDITARLLLLKRLPPETSWQTLEAELGVSYTTLSSFYQRKCKPLLRKFAQSQGYL
ncbi:MAG: sigma-70 family RNA polymerase sigma factor [Halothece sp.]